jgi:predicted nucleotidyltransferase
MVGGGSVLAMVSRIERVLVALGHAGVDYLVVGGVAVVMHGHLRTTQDLDLVVRLEPANVRLALEVLEDLGLRPRPPVPAAAFADPNQREDWILTKNMVVFSMWDPSDPTFDVDLFVREPFDFEVVYQRRLIVPMGTSYATVVSLEDLLALKRSAGRTQDLADIEALTALQVEDDQ